MNELTFILMLHFALGPAHCFPLSRGGNRSVKRFFCKIPGCAANVTKVFCNEELLLSHPQIENCAGPPPPNTVCKHGGRAFISTDTDGTCEFEGKDFIETEQCTDHSDICAFMWAITSPSSEIDPAVPWYIVCGLCALILIVGLSLYFCIKRRNGEQPASDSVTEPLREM